MTMSRGRFYDFAGKGHGAAAGRNPPNRTVFAGTLLLQAITQAVPSPAEVIENQTVGKAVAAQICAGCHAVVAGGATPAPAIDDDNRPTVAAPSFLSISAEYRGDPVRLGSALRLAHYPRPEPPLPPETIPPLVAHILSLRPSADPRP
ncbi:MAG TPA: hypothetical protein VM782_01415 [Stellaceae bacterium]|nr:hypothetical protein [Stellaceae bacterium]